MGKNERFCFCCASGHPEYSFDATEIMELRKKLKADKSDSGLAKITLNDMVVFAVSRTLPSFPDLNAHLIDDKMRIFRNAHVGVAVDTERGLMVPTLFDANRKSLLESSLEVKSLIEQCHAGNINPDYLQGGTFTVTNPTLWNRDLQSHYQPAPDRYSGSKHH